MGRGTLTGDLFNSGELRIGTDSTSGEMVSVNGNFWQTGDGELILQASPNGTDRLDVSGAAVLGGAFGLRAMGGYNPYPGTSFAVITYGTVGGAFDSIGLPELNSPYGGEWDVRWDDPVYPNALSLWVI